MRPPRSPRRIAAVLLALSVVGAACGSSSTAGPKKVPLTAVAGGVGIVPKDDGFAFANFPAANSPEIFNSSDLVDMFGKSACANGTTDPCVPIAQAAAWAQMVNEARLSGHCEGLAVQSSVRFNTKAEPPTVDLKNEGDVTHGIMRAFATQFLPEVQTATEAWAKKSVTEIVNELSESFKVGKSRYTLGLYTPTGGHAVLPYALEFPSDKLAVVKVYDSNWPGMERYVVIDLETETWYFSFSGTNPQKDECAWSGGAGDIDLTPLDARESGTCPFCGDATKVTKSVLFIRSTSLDWSVTTAKGTYKPSSGADTAADVSARAIRTATCEKEVRLPEFILATDTPDFSIELPDTASAYVSNGKSVVRIETKGRRKRTPVTFTQNEISIADTTTTVQVAVDNVIAKVDTNSSQIAIGENTITIDVGTGSKPVVVDADKPQVVVTETPAGSPTVQETKSLVNVVAEVPAELVPDPVKPGLSPVESRSLTSETYKETLTTVPTTPVTAPPVTTTSTTTTTSAPSGQGSGATSDGSSTTASTTAPSSSSSSSSSSSTAAPPTTQALNCVFTVGYYGIEGFVCNDGTIRNWKGYLNRFPGDTYYFNFGIPAYQYGDYDIHYVVESVPAGFTADGRYYGSNGCHPYGCPP